MRADYEQVKRVRETIALMANDSHFRDYANSLVALREDLISQACDERNSVNPNLQTQLIHTVGVLDEILQPIKEIYSQNFNV